MKGSLDHALKYGYGALPRFDSDGQHPVVMVPELLSPINDGTADVGGGVREKTMATDPVSSIYFAIF